ncbi:MAG: RNA polymerase sporulation sigma factor SigF [Bacillota bacterium]
MVNRLTEMNLPRFPLLKDSETKELLSKVKQGDEAARERLINCNLRLVFNLIQRFDNRGYELEDLFQIGTIGLIKAIDKFDLQYEVKFSTYAVPMIIGEIKRFLRDDSPIKVSRSLKELAYQVHRTRELLTMQLGREPTITEIAKELNSSEERVVTALESMQQPCSIYDTLYQDEGDPIFLLEQLKDEKDTKSLVDKLVLKEIMGKLPERHRKVILLRFFYDKTQNEVAQIVGLSQVQVSRIERQALKIMREHFNQETKFAR